ncbi:hypothetical protein SAMN04487906_0985 [Zhouia amylolytica]|uniref:Lipoprotein n=1 Tax=Zhouia amylolytica TaxID=376730 RepID=A0A1I6QY01_9FLAO|nr:hypothetical protein [Zhouia amylolytica]MCQ0110810.1 hypothetical protein [Zhouia amylolytica]SFS57367.1 hypothetical protein SAMN04487906_0985 [Zhouia amylolytica]
MKKLLLLLIVIFTIACSGVKKTQEAINTGNYDSAINLALTELRDNKSKKSNQPYIIMLEDAYAKATVRDLDHIKFLIKENNPENFEVIYEAYEKLKQRQQRIKPLLPLYITEEGRDAKFKFNDYSDEIIGFKNRTANYLYSKASKLLKTGKNKQDFRVAYEDFEYLNRINPNYKDVLNKMEEAHNKGTDFVEVALYNDTDMVIPKKLEEDLLSFNSYGINDFWTIYHSNPQPELSYDYTMDLAFKQINISPEQIKEREIIKEKQIKDGWKYATDNNGNKLKDSLGNFIKIDNFKTVRCVFYEFTQSKFVEVIGDVDFKESQTKQTLNSYPLASGYKFEHRFATYKGDRRALDNSLLPLLELRRIGFPSNEEMVYNAGEDLKATLKSIVSKQKFN